MYVLWSRRTPYDRPSRRFDQDGGDRDYMKRLGLPDRKVVDSYSSRKITKVPHHRKYLDTECPVSCNKVATTGLLLCHSIVK